MRILLVLSEPADRLRWEAAVRERGHLGISARPGPDAWRHALAGGLDLIIAQHEPGDGDARRLLLVVKDTALASPPSIMVLLPEEESELLLPLLQDGADDVLIGAVDAPTLRLRLTAAERRMARRTGVPAAPPPMPVLLMPSVQQAEPIPAIRPLEPLADALAAVSAAAAEAYHALPGDPGAARADLRLVLEGLRVVQRSVEQLLGPLPASSLAPAVAHVEAPPPAPSDDLRALVILAEDDEHVRRPLRRTLEHVGLEVIEAADGESALRLVMEHAARVKLVVTDHRMPRMTGAELVRELKRRMPHLPVVLVSGHGAEDIAVESGADAYLRKPFQLVDLARTARRLLAPLAA